MKKSALSLYSESGSLKLNAKEAGAHEERSESDAAGMREEARACCLLLRTMLLPLHCHVALDSASMAQNVRDLHAKWVRID